MSAPAPRAAILAIGTELTTGQITNRNAAWLAARLQDLGVEVTLHETVPDDRPLMRDALEHCAKAASLLFVTGGLGPTSDDFTRDVIADWVGRPLRFHSPSWDWIGRRLGKLGVPVAESNRQQCYFPEGADVLPNSRGTANGFAVDFGAGGRAWVFPGPPREVEAVWIEHVERELHARLPEREVLRLFTWQCMGKSEAELGEITEAALKGSGLAIGYRAHRPYVEIKAWVPEHAVAEAKTWLDRLEAAIGPWIFTRQGEDLAVPFLRQLARSEETEIIDNAFGGLLAERLGARLREPAMLAELGPSVTLATEWVAPVSPSEWVATILGQADPETLTLAAAGLGSSGEWTIGMRDGLTVKQQTIESPYRIAPTNASEGVAAEILDRIRRFGVEVTLKTWLGWLRERVN